MTGREQICFSIAYEIKSIFCELNIFYIILLHVLRALPRHTFKKTVGRKQVTTSLISRKGHSVQFTKTPYGHAKKIQTVEKGSFVRLFSHHICNKMTV